MTGYFKSRRPLSKWSKHGLTSLFIPGHDPPMEITVFGDVSLNPGPLLADYRADLRTTLAAIFGVFNREVLLLIRGTICYGFAPAATHTNLVPIWFLI